MSNLIQPSALQAFANAGVNWNSDNIKIVLLSSAYTYSSSHANLSDVPGGDIIATSGNLSGKSDTNGIFKANNVTFSALTGAQATQMWIYKDTGVAGTSTLLMYVNQGVGLPYTPSGIDLLIEWNAAGIASL